LHRFRLESELARRHRRAWCVLCRTVPDRRSFGLRAIGIPWETTISGIKAIGAGRHMKALAGWDLIMMESGSITAIGKANTAGWNTITARTMTMNAIFAITTGIATIIMTAIA